MSIYKKAALFLPVGAVGSWGIYHACTANKTADDVDFPKDSHIEETINKDLDISEVFEDVTSIKHIQSESKDNVARESSDDFWKTEPLRDKFKGESDAMIDLMEKYRKVDPVRYRYYYSKPKGREISLEQGKERVEIMRDYTMYVAGCRPWGTGWILDYVLPDENKGEKYPTTWFIASNAHVFGDRVIHFDQSNPYNQVLNKPGCGSGSGITLVKERVEHHESDFDRSTWKGEDSIFWYMKKQSNWYDVSYWKDKTPEIDSHKWYYTDNNPKLFYHPYQYLGTDRNKWPGRNFKDDSYGADFIVMEVNFSSENIAKLFTRDFYNKYDYEKGSKKDKALNFFAQTIADKYTETELLEKDIQVFGAGYPQNGLGNKSTSNYDIKQKRSSGFGYFSNLVLGEDKTLMGHTDLSTLSENELFAPYVWNGRTVHERGYGYVLDNHHLFGGASGSLWAEEDGSVLGILALASPKIKIGIIHPFKNKEIKNDKGVVIAPAYDLMEGVDGQNGSYKEQVQKYVLKNGKQTALSRLRNWS